MQDRHPTQPNLYTVKVFGLVPEWLLTCVVVCVGGCAIFLLLWRPWQKSRRNRPCGIRSFFLAGWSTLVGFCAITWLWTLDREPGGGWPMSLLVLASALLILVLTFLLEGLEAAHAD